MAKRNKAAKVNIPMCIAVFLFCLTLISIHLTTGLYAKYIVSEAGSDSARVIAFGDLTLTETGDFNEDGQLMIIPGVDLTKKAVVDFEGSEAATYVFIEVAPSEWQTSDNRSFDVNNGNKVLMQWSIADGWTYLKKSEDSYIYYLVLSPNSPLDAMDIIADNGNIDVSEYITRSEMQALTDVSIKLRATVVQSGGFEDPNAAWNSIAAKEGSAN